MSLKEMELSFGSLTQSNVRSLSKFVRRQQNWADSASFNLPLLNEDTLGKLSVSDWEDLLSSVFQSKIARLDLRNNCLGRNFLLGFSAACKCKQSSQSKLYDINLWLGFGQVRGIGEEDWEGFLRGVVHLGVEKLNLRSCNLGLPFANAFRSVMEGNETVKMLYLFGNSELKDIEWLPLTFLSMKGLKWLSIDTLAKPWPENVRKKLQRKLVAF